ncbi:MAG: deoxyribonuclease IV [Candidatus Bathyarchaeia archaeon]
MIRITSSIEGSELLKLGLHVSIQGTIDKAVDRAVERGCNTFQIFTGNPRGWRSKELSPEEVVAFVRKVKQHKICPVFGHVPYLLNLPSPKEDVYSKSMHSLMSELKKCGRLGIPYLVAHLGSHLGAGKEEGLRRTTNAINASFSNVGGDVMLLLENTAGSRNSIGSSFEEIRYIIDHIDVREHVGACFDTCHGFAAGYDLRMRSAVEDTIRKIDKTVGFERVKLVHLNDSIGDLGSRIDRHEHIGMGHIREAGFRNILGSKFGKLPLILETPIDERRSDIENLEKVMELAGGR